MNSGAAAACHELVQIYGSPGGPVQSLRGVSLSVPHGSCTVVAGESGAGKSTLLRILGLIESPAAGQLMIGGQDTFGLSRRARRRLAAEKLGHVFQSASHSILGYLNVEENLDLALAFRMSGKSAESRVVKRELIEMTQLQTVATHRIEDLTAGEQQRLAVCLAAAGHPSLIVADEPTANLDPAASLQLASSIRALTDAGQAFVIASHDSSILDIADRIVALSRGVVVSVTERGHDPMHPIDAAGRICLGDDGARLFPTGGAVVQPAPEGLDLR